MEMNELTIAGAETGKSSDDTVDAIIRSLAAGKRIPVRILDRTVVGKTMMSRSLASLFPAR